MPKHVGVFIRVMYTVSRSAYVGKYIDCGNLHGMSIIEYSIQFRIFCK